VRKADVKATVLIVDQDLGFVCWLGEILSEVGYQAVSALDRKSAMALLEELNQTVNLVIVNPTLPGVIELTRVLSRRDPSLKIIALGNPGTNMAGGLHAQATLERPSGSDPFSRQRCLKNVRTALKKARVAA
jgi:DNA-binding NtrC family response regulator